jgi:hypothetical protein
VIENQSGCLNAHWLVHVPPARHQEFKDKLPNWLEVATGIVYSPRAINIKTSSNPKGAGRYMLKGMYPSIAHSFDIRPEYQGWVTGRRIGHSKNIGPVALDRMRRAGKHPPARRYIPGRYGQSAYFAAPVNP